MNNPQVPAKVIVGNPLEFTTSEIKELERHTKLLLEAIRKREGHWVKRYMKTLQLINRGVSYAVNRAHLPSAYLPEATRLD